MSIDFNSKYGPAVAPAIALFVFSFFLVSPVTAQDNATLQGTVTLGESGQPIHNVLITVRQLKRTVSTDDNGKMCFKTSLLGAMKSWHISTEFRIWSRL